MSLILHLRITGGLLVLLALGHLLMPRRFRWKDELARLSLLNRQIFLVHTFFIGLVLVLMGLLSLLGSNLLVADTPLARTVSGGFAVFWAARLVIQWFVYSPRLWRGHRFNTFVHVLCSVLWMYFTGVYSIACLGG